MDPKELLARLTEERKMLLGQRSALVEALKANQSNLDANQGGIQTCQLLLKSAEIPPVDAPEPPNIEA